MVGLVSCGERTNIDVISSRETTHNQHTINKTVESTIINPTATPYPSVYGTDMCLLTLIKLRGEDNIRDKTVHLLHDSSTSGEATVVVPDLKEVIPLSHAH